MTEPFDLTQFGVVITPHAVVRYLQRAKGVDVQHGSLGTFASNREAKLGRRSADRESAQGLGNIDAVKAEMVADLKAGNGRSLTRMKECGKVKAYGDSGTLYYTERKKPGGPLVITTIWQD
jgi:hypothetical protein